MLFMRFFSVSYIFALIPTAAFAADPVDYRKDIKPVLHERCYACHGALAQKKKLRVDSGVENVEGRHCRARQAGRKRTDCPVNR